MDIINLTLNGTEKEVANINRPYCNIINRTASSLFVSSASGIAEGKRGVLEIKKGGQFPWSMAVNQKLYILGTGKVVLIPSGEAINFKEPSENSDSDGNTEANSNIPAPNLLVNPDFLINQRHKSGTVAVDEYAADMWKLTSGTAEVLSDGSIQLNGTLSQKLEKTPAAASVKCSVSAGTADYSNGIFTITASGETISWAKLENGTDSTRFVSPDPISELLKCQRYFIRLRNAHSKAYAYSGTGFMLSSTLATITFSLPVEMYSSKPVITASSESIPCILTPSVPVKEPLAATFSGTSATIGNSLAATFTVSGGASGEPAVFLLKPGTDYIDISAEP